jgi:hypothetical protein
VIEPSTSRRGLKMVIFIPTAYPDPSMIFKSSLRSEKLNSPPLSKRYTLYNLFLFHGFMKREKDHALIRSIAYGTLLIRRQEGEKQ